MYLTNITPRNYSQDGRNNTARLGLHTTQPSKRVLTSGLTSPSNRVIITPFSAFPSIHPDKEVGMSSKGFHSTKNKFKSSFDFEPSAIMNFATANTTRFEFDTKITPKHKRLATTLTGSFNVSEKGLYVARKPFQRPPSISLKEKISMDQFLFGTKITTPSKSFRFPLENAPSLNQEALSHQKVGLSHQSSMIHSARNLATPQTTTNQQAVNNESDFFYKTSLRTQSSKSAKQVLNEIKELGPFKISKFEESVTTPVHKENNAEKHVKFERKNSVKEDKNNLKHGKMKGAFIVNRGIIEANKKNLGSLEAISKEVKQRKLEIQQAIENSKEEVMVCVLEDSKAYGKLKYCFVGREGVRLHTMKAMESTSREDKVEFKIKMHDIQRLLHLDNSYKYLHLLNGMPILAFSQIPATEKVVVIGRNHVLGDTSRVTSDEIVKKFIDFHRRKTESISDLIGSLEIQENRGDVCKEVLQIIDNTHQLTSQQLNNLIDLSNQMQTKDFSEALQRAFHTSKIGTMIADEDRGSLYSEKSYIKLGESRKAQRRSSLEVLLNPRTDMMRRGSQQEIALEKDVDEYVKSTRLLRENKKITAYKTIIKEYKKGLKNVNFVATEEDDEYRLAPDPAAVAEAQREKLHIKVLKIDDNLESLLEKWRKKEGVETNDKDESEDKVEVIHTKVLSSMDVSKTKRAMTRNSITSIGKSGINQERKPAQEGSGAKKLPVKNFIEENSKPLDKKKNCIRQLEKVNGALTFKNIPRHLKDKNLSRHELLSVYTVYKALCEVTSQRYKEYNIEDGIDFHTFRHGIFNIAVQSEELGERLFFAIDKNFSGFLDWEEFLEVMVTIRAKTLHEKIDLFIKIADQDGNGTLSQEEIFGLSKICLGKFIKETPSGFLHELCEYFTKLIFETLGYDIDDEIPLEAMKDAIFSGNEESNLLAMFCGADV